MIEEERRKKLLKVVWISWNDAIQHSLLQRKKINGYNSGEKKRGKKRRGWSALKEENGSKILIKAKKKIRK